MNKFVQGKGWGCGGVPRTVTSMSNKFEHVGEEGLCIMGNGHMVAAPSVDRQTDTIENITFAIPLVGGNYILSFC